MNQTANYGLSQWEATDRILMENFNGDNQKVDAALKANADAAASAAAAAAAPEISGPEGREKDMANTSPWNLCGQVYS